MRAPGYKIVVSGVYVLLGTSLLSGIAGCGSHVDAPPALFPSGTFNPRARAAWDDRTDGPEQNFRFRDQQWHLRNMSAFTAWTVTQGNPDLIVAVIDTGVDYDHPALKGRVIKGPDFGDRDDDPMDESEHGTHVAGIIAADGDVKGIAPKVKILALKTAPSKDAPNYDFNDALARAIIYAAEHGASIINISQGIGQGSFKSCARVDQVDSAVNEAFNRGVSIITSAGNSALDYVRNQCSTWKKNVNTIPVIATNEMDQLASFSNYSNLDHPRAISAPGVNIFSTVPTRSVCKENVCELPYDYMQGTSMASPMVAGALALVRSAMYDDYVKVMTKKNQAPLSLRDFFHRQQLQARQELRLAISPARLAERLLFHFTNLNNDGESRDPARLVYDAERTPLFGFGRIDVGAVVQGASKVFSAYLGG